MGCTHTQLFKLSIQTHTMEGKPDPPNLRGIIPHSFYHIFDHVNSTKDQQFLIRASYLEIYNEEIRDLLSKDPKTNLELKENVDSGVYVKDLTAVVVKNVAGEILVCCCPQHNFIHDLPFFVTLYSVFPPVFLNPNQQRSTT